MGYERYPRGTDPQRDRYGSDEDFGRDFGRDYGSGRDYGYSGARDYRAAGQYDREATNRDRYGRPEYGNAGYARDQDRAGRGDAREGYGRSYGGQSYDPYGGDRGYARQGGQARYARGDEFHGSYASDGRRFEDVGARRHQDDDRARDRQPAGPRGGRAYGAAPQGYDYQDRGFIQRAGDEVRAWFGDEDAERRREADSRYDERYYENRGNGDRDDDYHSWRSTQIAALDRDYDEYRQENRSRFQNEFSSWRSNRQTQRDSLGQVKEHAEVLGSDGTHVGTVDKVRGDRIILTKSDADAGGHHHSIPSSWLASVDGDRVTLSKTADEAKKHWRDEEGNAALFADKAARAKDRDRAQAGYGAGGATAGSASSSASASSDGRVLNRSFSGTYDDDKQR